MTGQFRSAKNRKVLTDSEISGLIRISQNGGLTYVVSDRFYIIDDGVKKPMGSVSELLAFLRGLDEKRGTHYRLFDWDINGRVKK